MEEKKKFNLSKNDGEKKGPSKFNLSKGEEPSTIPQEKKKSRAIPFVAIGVAIVIIGLAIWYFASRPGSTRNQPQQTAQNSDTVGANVAKSSPSDVKSQKDTTATTKPTNSPSTENEPKISAASLNNKIPASFAAKSTSPGSVDDKIVGDLIKYLNSNPKASVTILGYASSEGPLELNKTLSKKRADAFKEYLVGKGIPSDRIKAIGKGIENPVASNETEEGRNKNRRVEILLQ